jgi:hypothetical protein
MARWIAILEDDISRVAAMRGVLAAVLPAFEPVVFDNVPDMVDWLNEHLAETVLICLDHDLGPNRQREAKVFDPGIGRDIADLLATLPAVCPVIVHSSNSIAVPGMLRVLGEAGWVSSAVVPGGDLRWVDEDWRQELEWYLARGLIFA